MNSSQLPQDLPAHYYTDDSRSQVTRSIIPCMVLATIALILRLASRRIRRSRLVVSDYLAIGGLVFSSIGSLLMITAVPFGLGLHIEFVPPSSIRLLMINIFVGEIIYGIGFTFVKLSIITLYRQLFPTRFMLASTTVLAVIFIMWGIAVILVSIFSCNPIRGFWDSYLPDYNEPTKCISTSWFYIGISIPNILTDAILLCLPMRDIWHLHLPWHTKLAISGLFTLGSFVIVASCFRIYYMLSLDTKDPSWSSTPGVVWSSMEMQISVVCCCLPTIRPVVSWLAPESIKRRLASSDRTLVINTYHRHKLQAPRNLDSQATAFGSEIELSPLRTYEIEDAITVAK